MRKITNSFLIVLSFISIIPAYVPSWTAENLRYFCVMLPIVGVIFGAFWLMSFHVLGMLAGLSSFLRGFMMMILTLALTGGLHLDGLMDTSDAIFSHRDRETRLRILSDTHAGSFAVMACVITLTAKTLLFSELFTQNISGYFLCFVPIYSRLGMAVLLNNLQFAKSNGLAVILGSSRNKRDNIFLMIMFAALSIVSMKIIPAMMILCVILHVIICVKIFGGITGDLLGAFVEASEVIMLFGTVIMICI